MALVRNWFFPLISDVFQVWKLYVQDESLEVAFMEPFSPLVDILYSCALVGHIAGKHICPSIFRPRRTDSTSDT